MQGSGAAIDWRNRHGVRPAAKYADPMRTEEFWLILEGAGRGPLGEAAALIALTTELQRLGPKAIDSFESHLGAQVARLDSKALRDIAEQLWLLTDESWLHFRAWCVGQGRAFVERLLERPSAVLRDLASRRDGPFDPPNGELFLYCSDYARIAGDRAVA